MKQFLPAFLLWLLHLNGTVAQSGSAQVCTSNCHGTLGVNIYPNGDFGSGIPNVIPINPGLAPGYIYQTNPPPNDGYYSIANSTTPWGWFAADKWINIEDNGPEPNGYMMVVNASYPPGMFFQNTVAVCEGTLYEFSVDVINIFESYFTGTIYPNLTFMIDNVAYCETGDIPNDEQWHTVRFSFTTAPGQTSVLLGMRNNAPGGYGNDLAIDNISFRACGPELLPPDTLWFCPGSSVQLQVQSLNSPFISTVYQWQILLNGNWENIPGADSIIWNVPNPQDGAEYRLLVASAMPNLAVPNCRVESKTIHLAQFPALVVTASGIDPACFGESSATVAAQAWSGLGPYAYAWSNGSTGNMITGLPAGNYLVTISDAMGCVGATEVAVNEAPQLISSIVSLPVSCFGGTNGQATATTTGGTFPYTFSWENGFSDNTIQGLSAGNYLLTVTDAHGCSLTTSASISTPTALEANAVATIVSCFGGADAMALASAIGGTGPYTYTWDHGQTTAQVGGLATGSYTVTVTDIQGCTASFSGSIETPTPLSSAVSGGMASCFGGNDGTAIVSATGGTGPYTFLWSSGSSTAHISGLEAGAYTVTITDAHGCSASNSGNIEEPLALASATSGGATSCFGGNDGTAMATATGGTEPYTFLWSNGQTTAQVGGMAVGPYSVTVTDAHGCPTMATGNIQEPSLLEANTLAGLASCFGGNDAMANASALGGTSPYTFLWSNGQTTAQIGGLTAGIYTVTTTDDHGCTAIRSVVVDQSSLLESTAFAIETSCFEGNDGFVSAHSNGGQAPYQYLWNNGQTTNTQSGLLAGLYSVTTSDALSCTAMTTVQVNQPTPVILGTAPGIVSCFGGTNGTLNALPSGGIGPYAIGWSTGQTGPMINGLTAGEYTLTATDAQGCTASSSAMVTEPIGLQSSTTTQNTTCFAGDNGTATLSLSGGTPPYSYLWQTGQTNAIAQQLHAGSYQVTTTDANGCTQTSSVSIGQPSAVSGIAQAQEAGCYDAATGQAWVSPAGGTPPYTFAWQNGQTTVQINGLPSGWYGLSITDAHLCLGLAQVWVGQPPPLLIDPLAQPVSCPEVADGMASVTAAGGVEPYLFSWSNGLLGPEIAALAMGTYSVTVTDAHGCTAQAAETVETGLPIEVDLGLNQTLLLGDELVLTAHTNLLQNEILDYSWSGSGGAIQCPDCFQYQFLPVESGCERVLVRSMNGCQATDEVCYTLRPRRRIYVPNVFRPDNSGENDFFTIYSDASVKQILYLKIYSRWGEQLFQADNIQTNYEPTGWDGVFRGQPMNPGVFAWVAEVEFIDGEVLFLKGDVTLVR